MDIANGITLALKQILSKLKLLNIVRSYTLKVDFGRIKEDLKDCLIEVAGLLRKCVKKISSKPRRAEIRNVIGVLVRKKNIKRPKDIQKKCEVETVNESGEKRCQQSGTGERRYLCEFCGLKFLNYRGLKTHIVKIHESGVTLNSKKSIWILTKEDKLEAHFKQQSENDTTQKNHCTESGPSSLAVDIPQQEVTCNATEITRDRDGKDAEKSLSCPHSGCHRIFQKPGSMKKHIRLKHGTKLEYKCSKCEKTFFEKGKLNRHILTHQQGQFECSKCQRVFHRMDNLRRHIASHLENVKTFECRFCKKTFSLKCNRNTHEANVHAIREIQCELCDKKCKNEATLKVHKKLHEENRISCSLCCKTFTRKAQYRNHLNKKHKGLSPFQKLFDTFATMGSTTT